MSERPRKRASTNAGCKPPRTLSGGSSRPILVIILVLCLALPSFAVSARIPRASAGLTIHPSSAQDSHAPETLTWRQRTAEEWATSDFEQTAYASGSGVSLAQAVFQGTPAGDYDDERRYTTAMVAFDADADGDSDLAIGNESPYISEELFLNDGHGIFHQVDAGDLNDVQSDFTTAMAAFDADGDGDQDIAVGNDDDERVNGIDLFLNDGSGHTTQTDAGDLEHTRSTGLLPFDADGDGDVDLAVAHSCFGNALYLNDGAVTSRWWQAATSTAAARPASGPRRRRRWRPGRGHTRQALPQRRRRWPDLDPRRRFRQRCRQRPGDARRGLGWRRRPGLARCALHQQRSGQLQTHPGRRLHRQQRPAPAALRCRWRWRRRPGS